MSFISPSLGQTTFHLGFNLPSSQASSCGGRVNRQTKLSQDSSGRTAFQRKLGEPKVTFQALSSPGATAPPCRHTPARQQPWQVIGIASRGRERQETRSPRSEMAVRTQPPTAQGLKRVILAQNRELLNTTPAHSKRLPLMPPL